MRKKRRSGSAAAVVRWSLIPPLAILAGFCAFVFPGYSFSAMVCCGIIGILLFYNLIQHLIPKRPRLWKPVKRIFTLCLCLGLLAAAVTECFILEASLGDPKEECEYIVVLGAKVREDGPSVSLMDRIRGAYTYLEERPDVIAVVSGGQGADEPMTEARCIYEHLVAMGIEEDRVWQEDKAASTWANLNYSLDLIEERTGTRPGKIGLVSSEYHLFRAGMLGKDCGVEIVGIPAATSRPGQKINHFMREVAGVWHYLIMGGQYD